MKVAILGTGSVGQAIGRGLVRSRHEVRFGSRDPGKAKVPPGTTAGSLREVAQWADAVILAVPYHAVRETARGAGPALVGGKVLIDATNPLSASTDLAVGFTTSGAEQIAELFPGARIVKAFNSVFAANMSTGKLGTEPLTLFVAGDDPKAKDVAMRLGRDIGFDAVDAGPLRAARLLEPVGMHLIALGYGMKMGTGIGYRLVRKAP